MNITEIVKELRNLAGESDKIEIYIPENDNGLKTGYSNAGKMIYFIADMLEK